MLLFRDRLMEGETKTFVVAKDWNECLSLCKHSSERENWQWSMAAIEVYLMNLSEVIKYYLSVGVEGILKSEFYIILEFEVSYTEL